MSIIIAIQYFMLIVLGLPLLYLCILSVSALIYHPSQIDEESDKTRKFAILIPAHNEEKVISNLMLDLQKLNYSDDQYKAFVIADNCSDKTADIVRDQGISVLERNNKNKKGKGYALRWGLQQIFRSYNTFDAIVILDADNRIYPDLLKIMNGEMEKGAEVIQGYISLKPEPGCWNCESTRLGFTMNNYVRAMGRRFFGLPTTLKGTGMCFSKHILEQYPWEAYSLTEDLEYGIKLLLEGKKVIFNPEKIGYAIMPKDPKNAESQRERWEIGRFPIVRNYGIRLLKATFSKFSVKYLDALIDLMIPPLVNLMAFVSLMIFGNLILWVLGFTQFGYIAIIWMSLLVFGLLHILIGLVAADADSMLYRVFTYVPKYALWKAKIYFKILLKGRTKEWVRTNRE